jgi:hypothetical protein
VVARRVLAGVSRSLALALAGAVEQQAVRPIEDTADPA